MKSVTIKWVKELQFELEEGSADTLDPKSLLLLSFAKCAGMTAAGLFQKSKIELLGFEITCSGQMSTPTLQAETVFTRLSIVYNVECARIEEQSRVSRAIALTNDRYCGVGQMLSRVAPVSHEIYIHSSETELV
ncbi:MAG: OsmC family protein [Rikenellaceae bacterium]|nr:OsmC family protein [Rikenellaceae bacterium]